MVNDEDETRVLDPERTVSDDPPEEECEDSVTQAEVCEIGDDRSSLASGEHQALKPGQTTEVCGNIIEGVTRSEPLPSFFEAPASDGDGWDDQSPREVHAPVVKESLASAATLMWHKDDLGNLELHRDSLPTPTPIGGLEPKMEFGLDGDTAHPPQVELMVLEPERLKCRIVLEKEANIGRLSKCELQIDDHSVSRMHARVRLRGDGQYEVEDLDSHNGTIVNGDKVSRAVLDFGDEILLGIVRLRFGLPSGSTPDDISEMGVPETEEPRPFKFNRTHMAVVVSVLLFVVTVGIVAWKQDSVGGDNYSQWFQGKSFPEFKKGVRAFSLRNWDQAFEYFQEARRMEPDREYIVDYLDAIDRERVAAENLMLAKKARDAREFASAQRLAQKAAGSIYSRGDAKEVLKAIELSAKMQFTRGRQMLLSGNLDGAIEVLEGVVKLLPEWGEAKSTLLYAKSLRNSSK